MTTLLVTSGPGPGLPRLLQGEAPSRERGRTGVAESLRLGSWACDGERFGLMVGGGDEEGIDVWSSSPSSLNCEGWLVGVTGLPRCGEGASLDVGRSVRVK